MKIKGLEHQCQKWQSAYIPPATYFFLPIFATYFYTYINAREIFEEKRKKRRVQGECGKPLGSGNRRQSEAKCLFCKERALPTRFGNLAVTIHHQPLRGRRERRKPLSRAGPAARAGSMPAPAATEKNGAGRQPAPGTTNAQPERVRE